MKGSRDIHVLCFPASHDLHWLRPMIYHCYWFGFCFSKQSDGSDALVRNIDHWYYSKQLLLGHCDLRFSILHLYKNCPLALDLSLMDLCIHNWDIASYIELLWLSWWASVVVAVVEHWKSFLCFFFTCSYSLLCWLLDGGGRGEGVGLGRCGSVWMCVLKTNIFS